MNILITGGANGLGRAITKILATKSNNNIYITYSKSKNNALDLASEFSNVHTINTNFKEIQSVDKLINQIPSLQLDVLINNAYIGEFLKAHFNKIPTEEFENSFIHNLIPTIKITQSCISSFKKRKKGKIITILSSALKNTPPIGSSIYVANKAYLQKLTHIWATENSKYNITSNCISPSFMQTEFTSEIDARIIENMKEMHPNKKLLTIEEVAETVSFLINSGGNLNGVDIVMNAGINI